MRPIEARDRWLLRGELRGGLWREMVALGVARLKRSRHRERGVTKSYQNQTSTTLICQKRLRRIHGLSNSNKKKKKKNKMKKTDKSAESLLVTGLWVRTTKSTLVYLMRTLMAVSINILLLKSRITNALLLAFSMTLLWQISKAQMLAASRGLTSAKYFPSNFMKNRAPSWLLHISWLRRTNSSSALALVKWLFIHS